MFIQCQVVTTMHPNCEIACRDDTQSVDSDEEKTVFPLKFCLHFNVMTKRLGRQKKKKKMGGGGGTYTALLSSMLMPNTTPLHIQKARPTANKDGGA